MTGAGSTSIQPPPTGHGEQIQGAPQSADETSGTGPHRPPTYTVTPSGSGGTEASRYGANATEATIEQEERR